MSSFAATKLGESGPPIIHSAAYMMKNNLEPSFFCVYPFAK